MSRVRCMCFCDCPNYEGPGNGVETDEGLCIDCREGDHSSAWDDDEREEGE